MLNKKQITFGSNLLFLFLNYLSFVVKYLENLSIFANFEVGMVSPRAVKVTYSGLFNCQLYKQSLTVMVSPLVLRYLTKQFSCLIQDSLYRPRLMGPGTPLLYRLRLIGGRTPSLFTN